MRWVGSPRPAWRSRGSRASWAGRGEAAGEPGRTSRPRSATSSATSSIRPTFSRAPKFLGGVDLGTILDVATSLAGADVPKLLSRQLPDKIEARFDWSTRVNQIRSARPLRPECRRCVAARNARTCQRADRKSGGDDLQRDGIDRAFSRSTFSASSQSGSTSSNSPPRPARSRTSRSISIPARRRSRSAGRSNL